jgi:hypothetical protein
VIVVNLDATGETLTFDTLDEYEVSDLWRMKRREYRASTRPWCCWICGDTDTIELHHRTYDRCGREPLDDLVPLCEVHHHEIEKHLRRDPGISRYFAHIDYRRHRIAREAGLTPRGEPHRVDALRWIGTRMDATVVRARLAA